MIATFLVWFILFLGIALWTSSGNRPLTPGAPQFKVREGDRLFFRNLRMSEYHLMEDSASGFEVLTHKELRDADFCLSILWNWRSDEAFIFPYRPDSCWIAVKAGEHRFSLRELDTEQAWNLGVASYNQLSESDTIWLQSECHNDLAFTSESQWGKAMEETLKDYFKLVHQLP